MLSVKEITEVYSNAQIKIDFLSSSHYYYSTLENRITQYLFDKIKKMMAIQLPHPKDDIELYKLMLDVNLLQKELYYCAYLIKHLYNPAPKKIEETKTIIPSAGLMNLKNKNIVADYSRGCFAGQSFQVNLIQNLFFPYPFTLNVLSMNTMDEFQYHYGNVEDAKNDENIFRTILQSRKHQVEKPE